MRDVFATTHFKFTICSISKSQDNTSIYTLRLYGEMWLTFLLKDKRPERSLRTPLKGPLSARLCGSTTQGNLTFSGSFLQG